MKITARIVEPNNINIEIHPRITLMDLPIKDNSLLINNEIYGICHTLFNNRDNDSFYEFEQVITKFPRNHSSPYKHLLLFGSIIFESEEINSLFRKVRLKTE
jgi:hypothetical protein